MSIVDYEIGEDTWIPPEETPCLNDPEAWAEPNVYNAEPNTKAWAKRTCKVVCPFTEACLAYALHLEEGRSHMYRYGIWGGTTPHERYQMYLGADRVDNQIDKEGEVA